MVKQSKTHKKTSTSEGSQDAPDISGSSHSVVQSELNFSNHFLIAMPTVLDPVFGGSVIYLCEHNESGALGLIINKPTDMTMEVLLDRIDLKLEISPNSLPIDRKPVMFGGPVQVERGFVLHAPPGQYSSMMIVTDEIALTTSRDVLEAVAEGTGPERILVSLGCSGWGAGQLEQEIARNGWLTVCADPHIIFELPIEDRFGAAMRLLGIDPVMLATEAGHA